MEIYWAIVRMEQDDSDDGVLQVCLQKFGLVQALKPCLSSFSTVNFKFAPIVSNQTLMI